LGEGIISCQRNLKIHPKSTVNVIFEKSNKTESFVLQNNFKDPLPILKPRKQYIKTKLFISKF